METFLYSVYLAESFAGVAVHKITDSSIRFPIFRVFLTWLMADHEDQNPRAEYWRNKLKNPDFRRRWDQQRNTKAPRPKPRELSTQEWGDVLSQMHLYSSTGVIHHRPQDIPEIHSRELKLDRGSEVVGQGQFGVIIKAEYNRMTVVVMKCTIDCSKEDKEKFKREIIIMGLIGQHTNILQLFGYCLDPLCIVMEYVKMGSLSQLLHHCEEETIEVIMADGRVKRNIIMGVAAGMCLLHSLDIVHGDLTPHNILISNAFTARIIGFGLCNLTGKTTSLIKMRGSRKQDEDFTGSIAGYVVPELWNPEVPGTEKGDVYSFGILLNEVVTEEMPFSEKVALFEGKGPHAAIEYAKLGHRPRMRSLSPRAPTLEQLITRCWQEDPEPRPDFECIQRIFLYSEEGLVIPNSFQLGGRGAGIDLFIKNFRHDNVHGVQPWSPEFE
ncbi:hypothetical protein RvY_04256 [Ramazzottius varieornatus]|uniref:Protein kinase domain-containing protein n=1 Tax=Ramazzottius varieornatus TaxID=947166 RepID=A0A1D1V123_RAMVA|nr:hypothetical protein RvY_04256 [Ramazzottius varieornatus]